MNVCRYCGEFFRSNSALRQHELRHRKNGPYKCKNCDHISFSKYHYKTHVQRHSEERPYVCLTCGKSFKTELDRRRHNEREIEGKFSCEICDMTFLSQTECLDHTDKHTGEKRHKCPAKDCGKSFRYKSNLYRHMKIHEGKEYTCDHCGRLFKSKSGLQCHIRYIQTAQSVKCPVCQKLFCNQKTLSRHMKCKHSL